MFRQKECATTKDLDILTRYRIINFCNLLIVVWKDSHVIYYAAVPTESEFDLDSTNDVMSWHDVIIL